MTTAHLRMKRKESPFTPLYSLTYNQDKYFLIHPINITCKVPFIHFNLINRFFLITRATHSTEHLLCFRKMEKKKTIPWY